MSWVEAVPWWLPTGAVAAMTLIAFLAVAAQPWRPARKLWALAVVLCGGLATAASAWQQANTREALGGETARLRELAERLGEVGRMLPGGPGTTPGETFDTVAAALRALNGKIRDLEEQIRVLQDQARHRTISPDIAAKMAEFLR